MLGNCYPSFNLVLYDQIGCKRCFSCLFSFRSSNELQTDLPNNTSSNASLVDSISKSGSSNDRRKVSREDIELFYMNRDEVVLTLLNRVQIEPQFTLLGMLSFLSISEIMFSKFFSFIMFLINLCMFRSHSLYRSRSHVYRRRRTLSRDCEIQTNGVGSETNRDDYPSQRIRGRRSPVRHTPESEEVKFLIRSIRHWILCDVDHKILWGQYSRNQDSKLVVITRYMFGCIHQKNLQVGQSPHHI
ncbi:hypothetical protein MKW92_011811 [Papaver armeniacum]|nr:hypothetical protein MKW92_011811 [Papaver armeniacum]